jgi:hypothetical protein
MPPIERSSTTRKAASRIHQYSNSDDVNGKGRKPLKNRTRTVRIELRQAWWRFDKGFRNRNTKGLSPLIKVLIGAAVVCMLWAANLPSSRRLESSISSKRTVPIQRPDSVEPQIKLNRFEGVDVFNAMPESLISSPNDDYGGLQITFLDKDEERKIRPDSMAFHGHVWSKEEFEESSWEEYYAFDDDHVRNIPFEEIKKQCRRVSFHRNYFPNCNSFHEIPLITGTNKFLGEGSYREAYLQHEPFDPTLVVKVQRFHNNPFNLDRYEFIRMDALVMERLTSSPRIADMYGHCATSVYTEFLPTESEAMIVPGEGDGKKLNDKDDVDPQK